jgi:putative nucleotidyltransferase with HDIG domain
MRFATRTFLLSFLPFAMLLTGSFWAVRTAALGAVRDGLRASVHDNQVALSRERARHQRETARVLRVVTENAALKAGFQLLLTERRARGDARRTVEDQLAEICSALEFDLLVVFGPEGEALAGVRRVDGRISALDLTREHPPHEGFFSNESGSYLLSSAPINQGGENLGSLSAGERFDLSDVGAPAVLTRAGNVVESNTKGVSKADLAEAFQDCDPAVECEVRLNGETYLSVPMENWPGEDSAASGAPRDAYLLRGLRSVDAASRPVQASLRSIFYSAGFTALLAALGLSVISSRSIVRPISTLVEHLRAGAKTGVLPELKADGIRIQEIRELAEGFDQAASAVRQGREQLVQAYVEFVGSLAQALDARDQYTAGHSWRVSEYSRAIAREMNLPGDDIATLRIAALLHDIGKMGISDSVLQKPGKLTPEEAALIEEHPVIGRRILEGVHGFQPYLAAVELHHENWDGSGYPRGLKGEETPLAARIVKVADAYDAMTSDRPYRKGMTHEDALQVLRRHSGTQMDAAVVSALARIPGLGTLARSNGPGGRDSLRSLADAVRRQTPAAEPIVLEETQT